MRETHVRPILLAVALLMASFFPARAAFTVCNKTARPVKVAVGRTNSADWMSQGWWTIAPKACTIMIRASLNARFYYLFATDGGSGSWDGTHGFCISPQDRFEIRGRGNCLAHGFEHQGFFQVDTGSAADYTQTLSD